MDKDSKDAAIALGAVAVVGIGSMLLMRKSKAKAVGKHPGDDITFYVRLKSTFSYSLSNISIAITVSELMSIPKLVVDLNSMETKTFNVTSVIPDSAEPGAYNVVVTAESPAIEPVTRTFAKVLKIV